MSEVPRRICLEKLVPAELAIRDAMLGVENMGADVRLTEAVILLRNAQNLVADFVDGLRPELSARAAAGMPSAEKTHRTAEQPYGRSAFQRWSDRAIGDAASALFLVAAELETLNTRPPAPPITTALPSTTPSTLRPRKTRTTTQEKTRGKNRAKRVTGRR
jgi:hypothetical protein